MVDEMQAEDAGLTRVERLELLRDARQRWWDAREEERALVARLLAEQEGMPDDRDGEGVDAAPSPAGDDLYDPEAADALPGDEALL